MTKLILYIVNAPQYFISHRLPIAKEMLALGYEVHVASTIRNGLDEQAVKLMCELGIIYHDNIIKRGDGGILGELANLRRCYSLIQRLGPDLLHLVTLKPVVYGSVAARVLRSGNVVAAVAGLGSVFVASTWKARLQRSFALTMMRFGLKRKCVRVIFQNEQDLCELIGLGVLNIEQARLISGSGVFLNDYSVVPEPSNRPVVVMAARLIKEKGVIEFADAASILLKRGIEVEMRLLGDIDEDNPSSLTAAEYRRLESEASIVLLGYRNDIAEQYKLANIVCLPSYREGLPKSLIEAAACGRAVVTTDVPGCRDAIIPEKTGVLVAARDSKALADAIQRLIESDSLRRSMGLAGRQLAENVFDIRKVVGKHIEIYKELLG